MTIRLPVFPEHNVHEDRLPDMTGLDISDPVPETTGSGDRSEPPFFAEEEQALLWFKEAYDQGLDIWDMANVRCNCVTEKLVGKAIKKYNIPRQKVSLISWCQGGVDEGPNLGHDMDMYDDCQDAFLSRTAIADAVDQSLRRLDTPYIDLLKIHKFDRNTPIEGTMKALHDLVESGKVRHVGASGMSDNQFICMQFVAARNGWTKFIPMQHRLSVLDKEFETDRETSRSWWFNVIKGDARLVPWAETCRGRLGALGVQTHTAQLVRRTRANAGQSAGGGSRR